jgi:hypothetical protein
VRSSRQARAVSGRTTPPPLASNSPTNGGVTSARAAAGAAILVGGVLSMGPTRAEEATPVRVRVIEDRIYGRVAYRYSIENNSQNASVVAFRLGEDAQRTRAQLRQPPFGWSDEKGLPLGSAFAPDGWTVEAVREDDEPLWFVEWFTSESDETLDIAPGEMRDGFALVVFDAAPEYLTSSWTVVFDNGQRTSGTVERDQ